MSDFLSKALRSELMAKIKGKDTGLVRAGMLLPHQTGIRFRRHPTSVLGRPDAGNKSKKIAVFFDSEFWHGHEWEKTRARLKSNKKFWIKKIERNMERDREVTRALRKQGWTVIRIWSRQLQKRRLEGTLTRIMRKLEGI